MNQINRWPLWAQAIFWNICCAVGVYAGFASSGVKASLNVQVYVAVFVIAFLNLMFLSVRPRILAERAAGRPVPSPWSVLYRLVAERPFVTALVILQLIGTAQATTTTIVLMRSSSSAYGQSLPNTQAMAARLVGSSALMAGVALLWLVSAIGLWQNRRWAWWLALTLNGLAAALTIALQVTILDQFVIDIRAVLAVILLLVGSFRKGFRGSQKMIREAAG